MTSSPILCTDGDGWMLATYAFPADADDLIGAARAVGRVGRIDLVPPDCRWSTRS